MSNFNFLKTIDKNLYSIISQAEKLYRDEYFDQCIGQTRKFGEVVCKNVLGDIRTSEKTFDDMLATLKDKVSNAVQEKEFIDDLYFIKKEGNIAVHSSNSKNNGILALECLQRAFEIAINYSVYYKKTNSNLLKLQYDTELLITGKQQKKSLSEKYTELKNKTKTSSKKHKRQKTQIVATKKKHTIFKIFIYISSIVSAFLIFAILLLNLV